jgi:hypothetical protein
VGIAFEMLIRKDSQFSTIQMQLSWGVGAAMALYLLLRYTG